MLNLINVHHLGPDQFLPRSREWSMRSDLTEVQPLKSYCEDPNVGFSSWCDREHEKIQHTSHKWRMSLSFSKILNNCEKETIRAKTKKKLNDNNVTEGKFLGGRVADIFLLGWGLLGAFKRPLSFRPAGCRALLQGNCLDFDFTWKKCFCSSAFHHWDVGTRLVA